MFLGVVRLRICFVGVSILYAGAAGCVGNLGAGRAFLRRLI
jgi:hypothetical protein